MDKLYVQDFQSKEKPKHGRKDEHLPIGEGLIDHEKTVRALKNIEYDRTITFEVFTNSNDAKSSTDKLKIIWAKGSC